MGKATALSLYVVLVVVTGLATAGRSGSAGGSIAVLAGAVIWAVLIWATWKGSKVAWGLLVLGACFGMLNHWVLATDAEGGASLLVPVALGVGQVVFLSMFRWPSGKE